MHGKVWDDANTLAIKESQKEGKFILGINLIYILFYNVVRTLLTISNSCYAYTHM